MLGTNLVLINLVHQEETPLKQEMVPIMPYIDKLISSTCSKLQEPQQIPYDHHLDLDVETLLYITCNNIRPQKQAPPKRKGC